MPKKKKFIDKKSAVTFHLVHRSQQDPLVADENAPQRVLLPVDGSSKQPEAKEKRIEEQHKYGIYFDDDYNYLQHLRTTGTNMEWEQVDRLPAPATAPKINLPSSVFASTVEEEVGLLNKAAPVTGLQLDLDPDVVAAMDDDFDFNDPDNELEDNFMELANAERSGSDFSGDASSEAGSNFSDEEMDELGSLKGSQLSFRDEETKSRFTDYSLSSSVIRRNGQLTLLDKRFEKMFASYDEHEVGALDCEEIEGFVPASSDVLLRMADEFEKLQAKEKLDKDELASRLRINSESDSEDELVKVQVPEKEKWDCQSILTTYSNVYNRPKVIDEPSKSKIRIDKKRGIPINVLDSNRLTAKALSQFDEENRFVNGRGPKSDGARSIMSTLSTLSIRPKDENSEEKKERKRLLREYRKERRLEKKVNSEAFRDESKRQVKIAINNRNNVQGNKIL